ncbi:MAG: PDZ domain-containing protein [Desulfamplus sp.]|nr:PDZ domain-containing protein [Desulfamplus sp.]
MENELNSKKERLLVEEKRILSMKRKMKWLSAGVVILTIVAVGLLGVAFFPNTIQKITNIKISFGATASTGSPGSGYLGIEIRDLPKSAGTSSLLSSGNVGVLVSRVAPSSPASQSGLKAGDIILRYNRTRITDSVQFKGLVAESSAGEKVTLVADRNNRTLYFSVLLTERPTSQIQLTAGPPFSQDDDVVEQWGCTLSPLTQALIQKLSIPSDITGIVVVSVSSSGLAKSAGILPGDVILSVNETEINGMAEFYTAIENQKNISLKIFRNGTIIVISFEQKSALPPLVTIAGSVPTAGMPTAGMPISGVQLPQIVAIASDGSDLNATMALRFGTAAWFIIIDTKSGQYMPLQNTAIIADSRGYGIVAAQLVASKGVGATVAGSYGIQAYNGLLSLNITPFVANPGRVIDVFNQYKQASLAQLNDDALSGFGYSRSIITTGGAPFATDDEDDEEEEQSGYKGMPYNIPAQGKYDPALDPTKTADSQTELTAGLITDSTADLYLNLNQQSVTCVCPSCGLTYDHPAGVPCSSLLCKACGSRLISLNTGSTASTSTSQTVQKSQTATISNSITAQKVAIAADSNSLNSPVAARFELAKYFIVVDINTGQYVAVENIAINYSSNFGVVAAQLVASKGAGATVAISYGQPSYYALKTLGITAYTATQVTVSTALNQYRTSSLNQVSDSALLPYTSYQQNYVTTGGAPFATDDEDDEEEEQSGYKGMPYNIPAQGKYDPALDPANALQTTAGTTTTQRAEYCLCPSCQTLVPHAAGIACSDMTCPKCGNRLMNADPGSSSASSDQTTATLLQNSTTQLIPQTQLRSSVYPTPTTTTTTTQTLVTDTPTQSQSRTGSGITVAGSTTLSTGVLQGTIDGSCLCPACGTSVPHVRGTACSSLACPRCGTAMIGENTSLQVTAGMPTLGAPEVLVGVPTAGMPTAGMPTAGAPEVVGQGVAGMPTAGAPEVVGQGVAGGMPTAGAPEVVGQGVAGMPQNLPSSNMGQSTAGMPTAGMPTAGMPTAGMPTAGMPTAGMPTAGMPTAGAPEVVGQGVAGMPENLPPINMGQSTAGLTVAGIPNISSQSVAGITVAGMPTAGVTIAGMPTSGMPETIPPPGMGPSATTVAGTNSGKICIAANGATINAQVADIFDKAPYFLMVGFGTMEVITNPNVTDKIGSGVQSAQLVVSEGADVVITNDIGIRAIEELNRLQVKVYTGVTGTVKEALTWYQNNRLTQTKLNSASDSVVNIDDEEGHGPPTSKSKSKGESTTL